MSRVEKSRRRDGFFVGAGKGLFTFLQGCGSATDGTERQSQKRFDDSVSRAGCQISRECRVFGLINLTDGLV